MTITLHGHAVSNYYNKVKMALIEKGVPFDEAITNIKSKDPAVLQASPLGKIPFLVTPQGPLCESQVMLDWLEATHPQPPLVPADPYGAAKVRELVTFIDWHLEMAARQLYGAAFFGATPLSEANRERVRGQIVGAVEGLRGLLKLSPFAAGDTFTQADCSAFNNLPLVGMSTKAVYGEDLLVAGGIDYKPYIKFLGERPSAQKVVADRKVAQAATAR